MLKSERLDKILANLGFGSRSEVRKLIVSGKVRIGSETVKDPSFHAEDGAEIFLEDSPVDRKKFHYFIMNKPSGFITATEDRREKTVMEIFPERIRRMKLFPVGRLDKDTEGLLLFTNDGDLAHRLISPKNMVEKVYYAVIEGTLDTEKIQKFETGLILEEGLVTMPAKLKIISEKDNGAETEVTVFEGKFHQVKRMFEAVGCRVGYLKRIRFGSLVLDETQLQTGKYRELSLEEESLIRL